MSGPTKIAQTRNAVAVSCATIGGVPNPFSLNNQNPTSASYLCHGQKTGALLWGADNMIFPSSESIDNANC